MKDFFYSFAERIKLEEIKIINFLPTFLLFGGGAADVRNVKEFDIKNVGGDAYHTKDKFFYGIKSQRAKYVKWFLKEKQRASEYYGIEKIIIPEDCIGWDTIDGEHKNLLDFEKDLVSLCSGILIFLESPGAIAELGTIVSMIDIQKKLFIVLNSQYVGTKSYIELGPLKKVQVHNFTGAINYFVLVDDASSESEEYVNHLSSQFEQIYDAFNSIAVTEHRITFDHRNEEHLLILIVDIISLFSMSPNIRLWGVERPAGLKALWIKEGLEKMGVQLEPAVVSNLLNRLVGLEILSLLHVGSDKYFILTANFYNEDLKLCAYKDRAGKHINRIEIAFNSRAKFFK